MIKGLFRLLLFVIAVVLIYNYFFGDAKEKEKSEQIVGQFKDLSKSITDMLLQEKEKLNEGKYDDALEKISDFIKSMRSQSDKLDVDGLKKLNELEKKKDALQRKLEESENDTTRSEEEIEQLNMEWNQLLEEMQQFIKDYK